MLIGFGSIDPNKGLAAIDEARRCVEVLGLKGFKLHPAIQRFAPNDERFYPLWDAISSLKVPALFHTGLAGSGPACPAATASSCATPSRCCWTTWRPTSRT